MRAILIKRDNSPKGYSEIKRDEYPSSNLNQIITFSGIPDADKYEWLHFYEARTAPNDYDSRIWTLDYVVVGITQIKHPDYLNINQFRTEITLVKKSNAEIETSIREKEAQVNSTLLAEGEKDKMYALTNLAQQRQYEGIPLTAQELAVLKRMKEIGVKVWQNSQIAEQLITIVNTNNEPDIDFVGWQTDNLNPCGPPFSL